LTEPATTARRDAGSWDRRHEDLRHDVTCRNAPDRLGDARGRGGRGALRHVQRAGRDPGVSINDDWDALGMRASGSGSITLRDVRVRALRCAATFPWENGVSPCSSRYLSAGLLHASASLGVAETAHALAVKAAATQRKGRHARPLAERPTIQILAAENAIDLAAMRAVFGRGGELIDRYFAAHWDRCRAARGRARRLHRGTEREDVRAPGGDPIVDRALTMSGGAGFMTKHPLTPLSRRARGAVHAAAGRERRLRVHRPGDARPRTTGGVAARTRSIAVASSPIDATNQEARHGG
jgi:alkylation response protein AidB-like acyl-CoA dehydrogenase